MTSQDILWLRPETWASLGSMAEVGLLGLGVVAGVVTYKQYQQSKEVRLDQTRPYMTISAERSPAAQHLIDIVIKNIGTTPAHDVRIEVDPPFRESDPHPDYTLSEALVFNRPIKMWAPGQVLRAFFDSHIDRKDKDLPSEHEVTITYHDGRGHGWEETSTLDLELGAGLMHVETYGVHHAAKALRTIAQVIKASPVLKRRQIEVVHESKTEREERLQEPAQHTQAMEAKLFPGRGTPEGEDRRTNDEPDA